MSDFPKKYEKKLPSGFKDSSESKKSDELEKEILKSTTIISDLEKELRENDRINALKSDLKDLTGGYRDEINTEKAKVAYCVHLLRSRGAL